MEHLHDASTLDVNGETVPLRTAPYIHITCGDRGISEGDFHSTVVASSKKMLDPNSVISAIYEVSAEMPKSPVSCGAGEVFSRFVAIGDKRLCESEHQESSLIRIEIPVNKWIHRICASPSMGTRAQDVF